MNEIFVFRSNLSGRHGKGAAKYAKLHHGAKYGIGEGLTGNSYAIPTKDHNIKTLSIDEIKIYVNAFLKYSKEHPDLIFNVTRVGCGLAGYKDHEIAPLFKGCSTNCKIPTEWIKYL